MPRARATITSLLDTHHAQLERVAELELQIEEATNTQTNANANAAANDTSDMSSSGGKTASSSLKDRPKLAFEDAVKAEEVALKVLEAKLAPLRRSRAEEAGSVNTSSRSRDPSPDKAKAQAQARAQGFTASSTLQSSPPIHTAAAAESANYSSHSHRTPAKTPTHSHPHRNITNSLVNGTTPRRARDYELAGQGMEPEFDRFSPLRFLGTPRASARASRLRGVVRRDVEEEEHEGEGEGTVGRGIFEKRATVGSSVQETPTKAPHGLSEDVQQGGLGGVRADEQGDQLQLDEDQTVRYASAISVEQDQATSRASVGHDEESKATPTMEDAEPSRVSVAGQSEPDGTVDGVLVSLPIVQQAIAKIWESLPEMMRQGLIDGQEAPQTVEATISHLSRLSRSDPDPPPSPSSRSTSTLSSGISSVHQTPASAKAASITPQTILTAHLLLTLLRAQPDAAVGMTELKDHLGAIARARGWEGADGLGAGAGGMSTKCIYAGVGKRVVTINRKNGARVMFAI